MTNRINNCKICKFCNHQNKYASKDYEYGFFLSFKLWKKFLAFVQVGFD